MRIPFLGSARSILSSTAGSTGTISTNISTQEVINFFLEQSPEGEQNPATYLPAHGATLWTTLSNASQIRGMLHSRVDFKVYVVSGDDFYEVDSAAVATDRGDLATSTGLVQMAINANTAEIVVVDGSSGRHFNYSTDTFGTITDADYPDNADCVFFINGYFVVNNKTTAGRFHWADLNDGLTWDAANFKTCESLGSTIIGMIEDRGVMWFLGETCGELWYHNGEATDAADAFVRFEKINVGCAARMTVQKFDNSIVWLSRTSTGQFNIVRAGQGYQPEVISTPEVSRKFEEIADNSATTSYAWTYTMGGHEFYVITVPSHFTLVYDAKTKTWHQRSGAFSSNLPTQHPVSCIAGNVTSGGTTGNLIVGDYNATGKLWVLQQDTYQWDSVNMPRRITSPLLSTPNEGKLRISEIQIDIEEGVNTGAETGDDGQLAFSYSKDGGHTYSSGTVQLELGTSYTHRLIKRKLGWGRLWNFRVYTDTPRKIVIKGAMARAYSENLSGTSNRRY
jgi:hypothetical protein